MKKSGAFLATYALEQIGIKYTFGIPGVHNTELYDELNNSKQIQPILVTHEGGASFMADGVSRTSNTIGTLVIVPAAGTTHAMSGIGEAFLDGIPMLIISGGTRRDSGRHYQLHQLDQSKLVKAITKKYFLATKHTDIIPIIFEAYNTAISGEPGPVFVEIPVELQLFSGEIDELPKYIPEPRKNNIDQEKITAAAELLAAAKNPGVYIGWGAIGASDEVQQIAEKLVAPVSTTLQGLSAFPGNHPLHTGLGFGASSLPSAQKAFENCDCLLAVGVRFSELATGSYGLNVPKNLIHIDINPQVFDKNYPTKVNIEGDSKAVLTELIHALNKHDLKTEFKEKSVPKRIQVEKQKYLESWYTKENDQLVSPGLFFKALRKKVADDVFVIADDGKHTFLTAELFPVHQPRHFISPTDFNCMGYAVPSSIGVKMSNPDKQVVAIVGDGAFMMTGMELITASTYGVGVMVFVFHDGELGQISQLQKIPLNRKTCSVIGSLNVKGVAIATGAHFISMQNDRDIDQVLDEAIEISQTGQPVLVDVNIDYSRKTMLTKGVVKTTLKRFPIKEKFRFISRAIKRKVFG